MPTYKVVKFSLQIPRLDQNSKVSKTSNVLAVGGKTIELSDAEAAPFVDSGQLELVPESKQETELAEGAEVNGPGADALTGITPEKVLERPANSARKEEWVAYAQQEGVSADGTRDEIRARVDEKLGDAEKTEPEVESTKDTATPSKSKK